MNSLYVAGIDVGSVAAKAVVRNVLSGTTQGIAVIPTGWNAAEAGRAVLTLACREAGISQKDIQYITATGYGRVSLPFAQRTVTEITCHAKGAHHLFPHTGIVLDIGGQDSKVIRVDADGSVQDFVMNDKCAAGTGRFLQVVSGILDCSLDDLSQLAAKGSPAPISSMCAVFAETEIVGLLARGVKPMDIAAGVLLSIARRMCTLAARIPRQGECTFTGGLAISPAFSVMLSGQLGTPVNIAKHPQTVGALGAALIAEERVLQLQGAAS